ncbi:MAG: cob(I)yrinic acid a,c-diamide adenosyltransferase [Candidatus Latescibacteria bacterium]|nr:cob(I)yrinic acid a,c-diamide adenosyltransferase [Candidatus Latescibacterota bacterium]
MVRLTRIYTRTGDGGKTRLGDNSRVSKTDIRLEAYGTVDELNAVLGMALSSGGLEEDLALILRQVQNELFDLGADLCTPLVEGEEGTRLRITALQVEGLETQIDQFNEGLPPLKSFVLPGGRVGNAWLHLARTVCRRAERCAWKLAQATLVNGQALIYLNRLSDLLFVMARRAGGGEEVLWVPGQSRR